MKLVTKLVKPLVAMSLILLGLSAWAQTDTDTAAEQADSASSDETVSSRHHSTRYACSLGELQRRVEIDFPNAPTLLPCEVNYYKDTEAPGNKTTLWMAENTEGYCEEKAAGLVDKLRSQGWDCQTQ